MPALKPKSLTEGYTIGPNSFNHWEAPVVKLVEFGSMTKWFTRDIQPHLTENCKKRKLDVTGTLQEQIERLTDSEMRKVSEKHAKLLAEMETEEDTAMWYKKLKAADEALVEAKLCAIANKVAARRMALGANGIGDLGEPDVVEFKKRETEKVMAESKDLLARLEKEKIARDKEYARVFQARVASGMSPAEANEAGTPKAAPRPKANRPKTTSTKTAGPKEVIDLTGDKKFIDLTEDANEADVRISSVPDAKAPEMEVRVSKSVVLEQKTMDIEQDQSVSSPEPTGISPKSALKRRATNEADHLSQPDQSTALSTDTIPSPPKKPRLEDSPNTNPVSPKAPTLPPVVQDPKFPTKNELKKLRKDLPYLKLCIQKEVLFISISDLPYALNNTYNLNFAGSVFDLRSVVEDQSVGYFLLFDGTELGRGKALEYLKRHEGRPISDGTAILKFKWIPSASSREAKKKEDIRIVEENKRKKELAKSTGR